MSREITPGFDRAIIDEVYNQKRLHSALGYPPQVEFEQVQGVSSRMPDGGARMIGTRRRPLILPIEQIRNCSLR